jgi:endonuclease/exonuclease/phosphatase family metal-dependent hydrolase
MPKELGTTRTCMRYWNVNEERETGNVELKVMSFNICHGLGIDGRQRLERTIDVIRASGADLVGLQEVDRRFGDRSGWEDQPAKLAEALGMFYAYGANLDEDPAPGSGGSRRQYGNAVLSRFPITYSRNHPLPQVVVQGAWNEKRGLLETHVQIEGTTVRFFNTHLGLTKAERNVQVEVLIDLYRQGGSRCICTGDFNAEPGSPELEPLRRTFRDAYAEAHGGRHAGTFLSSAGGAPPKPVQCIDYVFCSPDFRVTGAATLDTRVSDHLPLTANLVLTSLPEET